MEKQEKVLFFVFADVWSQKTHKSKKRFFQYQATQVKKTF
jgi:hypothetical protein